MISDAVSGLAIMRHIGPWSAPVCIYNYRPGDCYCRIDGLGIVVRHSDGGTLLIGESGVPHPAELDALGRLEWTAAHSYVAR